MSPATASGRRFLTSLDRLETIEQRLDRMDSTATQEPLILSRYQRWAHSRWMNLREHLIASMASSDDSDHWKRAERMEECCRFPQLRISLSDGPSISATRCRDRLCPLCQRRRAQETTERLRCLLDHCDSARLLTLTAPAIDAPLREQMEGLKDAWRQLRRAISWKKNVVGGAYAWQITRSEKTGLWHPHLHVIIDGGYFPHDTIREAWRHALNASTGPWILLDDEPLVVDIRMAYSSRKTAGYIARYITSPDDMEQWPSQAVIEYAAAMHGLRLVAAFGSLHGVKLDPKDPNETAEGSQWIADMSMIRDGAEAGLYAAQQILYILWHTLPTHRSWLPDPPKLTAPPGPGTPSDWIELLPDLAVQLGREWWAMLNGQASSLTMSDAETKRRLEARIKRAQGRLFA